MNLDEFATEMNSVKNDFTNALDDIFRSAIAHVDDAHARAQARIDMEKSSLFGEPVVEELSDIPSTSFPIKAQDNFHRA